MQKEMEMQEYGESAVVGTQILDPNLPSDLNFDDNKGQKEKQQEIFSPPVAEPKITFNSDIQSYKVKGKINESIGQEYHCGAVIKEEVNCLNVKSYDEDKSQGMKGFWESLVGYSKRQLLIQGGFLYLLSACNQGFLVHSAWKLDRIFKVFVDSEDNKFRLVIRDDNDHLVTKNFQTKQYQEFIERLSEQLSKVGLHLTE